MFGDDPMKKDEIPLEDRDKVLPSKENGQGSGLYLADL